MNDALLGLKLPSSMMRELRLKYPNVTVRNMVLRALIQRLLEGKIVINSYEIKLPKQSS
jgi:hypothetical protein